MKIKTMTRQCSIFGKPTLQLIKFECFSKSTHLEDVLVMTDLPQPAEKMQLPTPHRCRYPFQTWISPTATLRLGTSSCEATTAQIRRACRQRRSSWRAWSRRVEGNWRCHFCERDLLDTELEEHLTPYAIGDGQTQWQGSGHHHSLRIQIRRQRPARQHVGRFG